MTFDPEKCWHKTHMANWSTWFSHLAGRPLRVAEIGCFEGLATTWMLQNLLTHQDSRIVCYDIWWNPETERRFDGNVWETGQSHKVEKKKGNTLESLRWMSGEFDLIYVDACHEARYAMSDMLLAWPRLKVGGLFILDDYLWTQPDHLSHLLPTKPAIDAFMAFYAGHFELISQGWQVLLKKTLHHNHTPTKPC